MVRIGGGASGGGSYASGKYALQHQPAIDDLRAPPVLNTWYTLIDTFEAGIIELIEYAQTNTEEAAKNIEWELTIDEQVYTNPSVSTNFNELKYITRSKGLGDAGTYEPNDAAWSPGTSYVDSIGSEKASTPMYFHKFKFRYRLTSAAGTAQTLECMIQYCLMRLVT